MEGKRAEEAVVAAGGRRGHGERGKAEKHVLRACGSAFFHALGDAEQESTTKLHRVARDVASRGVDEVVCGGTFTVVLTRTPAGHHQQLPAWLCSPFVR